MNSLFEKVKHFVTAEFPSLFWQVVSNPVRFFRSMPKGGGYGDPILFIVVVSIISVIINIILSIIGVGFFFSIGVAFMMIIIGPLMAVIMSFVGAAILFVIWRVMGSQESFETCYRCGAYASGISPITTIIAVIPYAGAILSFAWVCFLLVVASAEVHGLSMKKAWIVFGVIFGFFAIMSLGAQHTARRFEADMGSFKPVEKGASRDMSPEKAGKFVEGMMKAIQEQEKK